MLQALAADKRRVSVVGCNSCGKDWVGRPRRPLVDRDAPTGPRPSSPAPPSARSRRFVWRRDARRPRSHRDTVDCTGKIVRAGEYRHRRPTALPSASHFRPPASTSRASTPQSSWSLSPRPTPSSQEHMDALKRLNPKPPAPAPATRSPSAASSTTPTTARARCTSASRSPLTIPPTYGRDASMRSPASSHPRTSTNDAASGARIPTLHRLHPRTVPALPRRLPHLARPRRRRRPTLAARNSARSGGGGRTQRTTEARYARKPSPQPSPDFGGGGHHAPHRCGGQPRRGGGFGRAKRASGSLSPCGRGLG